MAINYAKALNRRVTPQSQSIPGSTQVPNSAGGYSWQVDDWASARSAASARICSTSPKYVNALRGWGRGLRGAVGSARTLLKQISTRTCCFTVCPNFPEKAVTVYRA